MVDGNGLENRRGATHREFESRPLRQENRRPFGRLFSCLGSTYELAGFAKQNDREFGVVQRRAGKVYFCQHKQTKERSET